MLQRVIGSGRQRLLFDVLSLHLFPRRHRARNCRGDARHLAEHDLEKAIWITETNAAPIRIGCVH